MKIARFLVFCLAVSLSFVANAQKTQEQVKKEWEAYYALSKKLNRMDAKFIAKEVESKGKDQPQAPKKAKDFGFGRLNITPAFLKSEEGKRFIDIVISYQTPSGGWSKEVDMSTSKRRKGESFGENMKNYVPTFDNGATTTQLNILAEAASLGNNKAQKAFLKGLDLLINAQYPNGGWPQSYPLDGGYHDLVTFNDRSTVSIMEILMAVANGDKNFTFVAKKNRKAANDAFLKGVNCILLSQVNNSGKYSIWAAQYDQYALKPAKARAFEPASLATAESTDILMLLMSIEKPPAVVVQAVDDAVNWLESNKMVGYSWETEKGLLSKDPNAKPLWARFYGVESGKPVFGDRNGKVYNSVSDISSERRSGYGWYKTDPNKMLKMYKSWRVAIREM